MVSTTLRKLGWGPIVFIRPHKFGAPENVQSVSASIGVKRPYFIRTQCSVVDADLVDPAVQVAADVFFG